LKAWQNQVPYWKVQNAKRAHATLEEKNQASVKIVMPLQLCMYPQL
jgi:hypothetical protein